MIHPGRYDAHPMDQYWDVHAQYRTYEALMSIVGITIPLLVYLISSLA